MGGLLSTFRVVTGRAPALLALALSAAALAGCSTTLFGPNANQASLQVPAKPELSPAVQREHQRILSAYGGAYQHPRLEPMLNDTVEKLVAASERPDLKYEITILNSPSVKNGRWIEVTPKSFKSAKPSSNTNS